MHSTSPQVPRRQTVRTGSRRRAGLAAVGLVTGLALAASPIAPGHADGATPPAAPDAQAAQVAQQTKGMAISGVAALTSTKRKKLGVRVSASTSAAGGNLVVGLTRSTEEHAWSFRVSKKTLTLAASGRGTLVTKTQIKPFGSIRLAIKPSGKWKTKRCQGQIVWKRRSLKMVGLFTFDTSSPWGSVGGKKVTFKGGSLVRSTGHECPGDGTGGDGDGAGDPCAGPVGTWIASELASGETLTSSWIPGKKKASLVASRSVQLAKPTQATRTDLRFAKVPAPQFVDGGASATVHATSQAPAVGSATLTGSNGFPLTRPCKGGGTYQQTVWTADYANGGPALAMKMSAFGNISVADGSMVGTIIYSGPSS